MSQGVNYGGFAVTRCWFVFVADSGCADSKRAFFNLLCLCQALIFAPSLRPTESVSIRVATHGVGDGFAELMLAIASPRLGILRDLVAFALTFGFAPSGAGGPSLAAGESGGDDATDDAGGDPAGATAAIAAASDGVRRRDVFFAIGAASAPASERGGAAATPGAVVGSPRVDTVAATSPSDCAGAAAYVAARPALAARVGDATGADVDTWRVAEVGDGNINFVFILEGPSGSLVVKQALPYIRIAPDWPLAAARAGVEAAALEAHGALAPGLAPTLYLFDPAACVLALERVPPPAAVVRPLLVAGAILPGLAGDVAEYAARTLFGTSPLALSSTAWRSLAARFDNPALCELTERVIFVDPFCEAATNQGKSGAVAAAVTALRSDAAAAAASARLLSRFASTRQAVLHGDLHTGSVMARADGQGAAVVIDPEFACAGPVGFDVGKFAANLLIALLAADGRRSSRGGAHADADVERQQAWLGEAVPAFWRAFASRFRALWTAAAAAATDACATPPALFGPGAPASNACLVATQDAYMEGVLDDAVRFGGVVLLRRVVGIAAVADFKAIPDAAARSACELAALRLGRAMLVGGAAAFAGYEEVVKAARGGA